MVSPLLKIESLSWFKVDWTMVRFKKHYGQKVMSRVCALSALNVHHLDMIRS